MKMNLLSNLTSLLLLSALSLTATEVPVAIPHAILTWTEQQVEKQLNGIVTPSPAMSQLIQTLDSMSEEDASFALNTLSGQQHCDDLITTELKNRQFIRRLYDPLRPIVTSVPDPSRYYDPYYFIKKRDCGLNLWAEANGGQIYLNGYQDTYKSATSGYAVTAGLQDSFCYDWTLGLAGSYEYDRLTYDGHGCGKSKTGYLGFYGLYRPPAWYLIGDLAWGYSINTLDREIAVGEQIYRTHCNPTINQYNIYGELGCDINTVVCIPYLFVQPFIGVEVGTYARQRISEHGKNGIQLYVHSLTRTNTFTRIGMHLTSIPLPHDIKVSFDFAWVKRWSNRNNFLDVTFVNFGDTFQVLGENLDKNNVEGALTVSCMLRDNLRIYGEAYGEVGGKFYTYNVTGGLAFLW